MAIAISSGFCAESTREIEEKTSQQNNTDYATAEHSRRVFESMTSSAV
jgi:hypothetical protein